MSDKSRVRRRRSATVLASMVASATVFATVAAWGSDALAFAPPASNAPPLKDYVVKKGETCSGIAKRWFGARKHYDIIHQYNDLGPLPHKLKAGTVLRLPEKVPTRPDAELTQARRRVQARPPKDPKWAAAQPGLDLFRGWRVNTLEDAFAEVTFRDDSKIHLRDNTLVIIYGSASQSSRRKTTVARLDEGALRSSLGALSGRSTLKVETPSANTTLSGGQALIKVDPEGTSRVANHGDGKAAVVSKTKRRKRVSVPRGMGSKVVRGKPPTKPRPLPATPTWSTESPKRFLVPSGRMASISGSWSAIEGAASYRVELGQEAEGGFSSHGVVVPGTTDRFEAHGLPAGRHFAIVSATDDDSFESIPSRIHWVQIDTMVVTGPDGEVLAAADDGDKTSTKVQALPLLVGSTLQAPDGVSCAIGSGPAASVSTVTARGEQAVRCTDASGTAVPAFGVHVDRLVLEPAQASAGATGTPTLKAGETLTLTFAVRSSAAIPSDLRVRAPDGYTVSDVRVGDDGTIAFDVTAPATAGGDVRLGLLSGPTDREIEVGEAAVTVEPLPKAARKRAREREEAEVVQGRWIDRYPPTRHQVEIGLFGGVVRPHPRLELFNSDRTAPDLGFKPFAPWAGIMGARVGYAPLRVLAFEVEGAVAPTRAGGDPAVVFSVRGHALAQLNRYRVTPFILAGANALGVVSEARVVGTDVDPALHFGAGAKLYATDRLMLRLDVRDTVSAQRGVANGVAHTVEATVTIGLAFRRGKNK